jgi:RNA polymerase sigma-70 factor (ECF subfamily)
VAKLLLIAMSTVARGGGVRLDVTEVNGQPGAMVFDAHDRLVAVLGLDIAEGQVQAIHSIVNPDKLRHIDRVGDLVALVRAGRRPRAAEPLAKPTAASPSNDPTNGSRS